MPRNLFQALAFLAGFWLALSVAPMTVKAQRHGAGPHEARLEATFHAAVNAVRAKRNMITLQRDPNLDEVARAHSLDMAQRRYLSHVNPEGLNPLQRIQAAGISGFTLAAENAGQTQASDSNGEILRGWLESPDHRQNLHMPAFNRTGVGVARGPDGTWYYTQLYLSVPR